MTVPLYLAELVPSLRGVLGILNQLFIVFGLLLGQSLAFPFGRAYAWRYTMVVAAGLAVLQFLGGFLVKEKIKVVREQEEEEGAPLLPAEEEGALSLKGVLTSQDKVVRRGCE